VANLNYNSVDLSIYGLVTPGVSGAHDLPGVETAETYCPGSDAPDVRVVRRSTRILQFKCVVYSDRSHAILVSKLQALKRYLSPDLGFKVLTLTDITSKRISAMCLGFPINIASIPYVQTVVEFTLQFRCAAPWWEDASAQIATVAKVATTGSINNTGDTHCWPVYTCTVGASPLAGGLTFTVGGKTYTYEDALLAADVLVVDTEACTTELNGTAAMAGTADDCEYPELVTGANAVTAKTAGFTLVASYRRRYE
jgi:hypothetical protein